MDQNERGSQSDCEVRASTTLHDCIRLGYSWYTPGVPSRDNGCRYPSARPPCASQRTSVFHAISSIVSVVSSILQWHHNGVNGISNHQPHHCLLSRLFGRRSKKTSKHHVTGLCVWNSQGTGEFPAQMASYAENVSIWWRNHDKRKYMLYRVRIRQPVNVFSLLLFLVSLE